MPQINASLYIWTEKLMTGTWLDISDCIYDAFCVFLLGIRVKHLPDDAVHIIWKYYLECCKCDLVDKEPSLIEKLIERCTTCQCI